MLIKRVNAFPLIVTIFFCFFISFQLSATVLEVNDSSIKQQYSKELFLKKYGSDDSSKALIEFFFKKRHEGKLETIIWPAVGIAATLLTIAYFNSKGNNALGGFLVLISLGLLPYASVAGILSGIFKLIRFRKARLVLALERYQAGKGIRKSLKRDKIFKKELAVLQKSPK